MKGMNLSFYDFGGIDMDPIMLQYKACNAWVLTLVAYNV